MGVVEFFAGTTAGRQASDVADELGEGDLVGAADDFAGETDESVGRQFDDETGGGIVDETAVFSPSLFVSSLTFGAISPEGAAEAGVPDSTDVDDVGTGLSSGGGALDDAFGEFADGTEGRGSSVPALVGRGVRFVGEHPILVAGLVALAYLTPLLTSSLGVLEGVAGE